MFIINEIISTEVAPARGGNEPVAMALGAAAAIALIKGPLEQIDISVDPNIYGDRLAVSIPGTDGLSGLDTATALGAMKEMGRCDDSVFSEALTAQPHADSLRQNPYRLAVWGGPSQREPLRPPEPSVCGAGFLNHIDATITNLTEDLAGVIGDGPTKAG